MMAKPISILIRVDSGHLVGSGHLMRCLALADALRERGNSIAFVCRMLEGALIERINAAGFRFGLIPPSRGNSEPLESIGMLHGNYLASSQSEDASESVKFFDNICPDVVIIDHYGIDYRWHEAVNRDGRLKIAVIDDIADRPHCCDLLVDQNFYADYERRYENLIPKASARLLGPRFALIRPQFRSLREEMGNAIRNKWPAIKPRILVFFGGFDLLSYGIKIAELLLEDLGCSVDLMGAYDDTNQKLALNNLANKYGDRLKLTGHTSTPWLNMGAADLYIGAGGSVTWERFALGLPGIVYSVSKNQEVASQDLDKAGYQVYLGSIENFCERMLIYTIQSLLNAPTLQNIVQRTMALVDGRGLERVASAVETLVIGRNA